mmetsp:Transcript_42568/g.132409  ORF Transcript_42568/g.132409 Transcript_42568/m.132409 type:complete len:278 (+) Transcript_42568:1303-2136(+)
MRAGALPRAADGGVRATALLLNFAQGSTWWLLGPLGALIPRRKSVPLARARSRHDQRALLPRHQDRALAPRGLCRLHARGYHHRRPGARRRALFAQQRLLGILPPQARRHLQRQERPGELPRRHPHPASGRGVRGRRPGSQEAPLWALGGPPVEGAQPDDQPHPGHGHAEAPGRPFRLPREDGCDLVRPPFGRQRPAAVPRHPLPGGGHRSLGQGLEPPRGVVTPRGPGVPHAGRRGEERGTQGFPTLRSGQLPALKLTGGLLDIHLFTNLDRACES